MFNSPIGWVGGKRRLRTAIINRFPEHTAYVEAFAGASDPQLLMTWQARRSYSPC